MEKVAIVIPARYASTRLPANAADIPKKNIANENAHSIVLVLHPNPNAISSRSNDQQYTVPIEQ